MSCVQTINTVYGRLSGLVTSCEDTAFYNTLELLDYLKETRGYWKLKEAVDRTLWRKRL